MPNPMALLATIEAVELFNETIDLFPHLTQYKGQSLFITAIVPASPSPADPNPVQITIDDIGPPATNLVLPAGTTTATASVSIRQLPASTTVRLKTGIVATDKPLVLTAKITPPAAGKWTGARVTPSVLEWQDLPVQRGVEFVIRHDVEGQDGKLWWLPNPLNVAVDSTRQTAAFIPENPGGQVQGPFGLNQPGG